MATALTPEQTAQFSSLIDAVLETSDLDTISAKKVRKAIQAAVAYDVNPYKDAINALIHTRFELIAPKPEPPADPQPLPPPITLPTAPPPSAQLPLPHSNGTSALKRSASPHTDDVSSLPAQSSPPPAKKHKKNISDLDADALYAAKLQALENAPHARTTRNVANGTERKPKAKKNAAIKKKKSKARVTSDDDTSNIDTEKKVNRTGGFHKPMGLQPPLADLLGVDKLSRPQTVKQLWVYIKERNLQDPEDKRVILCDEGLRRVFQKDKLQMFSMNKQLSTLLYALDE